MGGAAQGTATATYTEEVVMQLINMMVEPPYTTVELFRAPGFVDDGTSQSQSSRRLALGTGGPRPRLSPQPVCLPWPGRPPSAGGPAGRHRSEGCPRPVVAWLPRRRGHILFVVWRRRQGKDKGKGLTRTLPFGFTSRARQVQIKVALAVACRSEDTQKRLGQEESLDYNMAINVHGG